MHNLKGNSIICSPCERWDKVLDLFQFDKAQITALKPIRKGSR